MKKLIVRQTARNLDTLSNMLAMCLAIRSPTFSSNSSPAGESGRFVVRLPGGGRLASLEDLGAIEPEKYRTKPAGYVPMATEFAARHMPSPGRFQRVPAFGPAIWRKNPVALWYIRPPPQLSFRPRLHPCWPCKHSTFARKTHDGHTGRITGQWDYAARNVGVEISAGALLEEDDRSILLNFNPKLADLVGWLEFPVLPLGHRWHPGADSKASLSARDVQPR